MKCLITKKSYYLIHILSVRLDLYWQHIIETGSISQLYIPTLSHKTSQQIKTCSVVNETSKNLELAFEASIYVLAFLPVQCEKIFFGIIILTKARDKNYTI